MFIFSALGIKIFMDCVLNHSSDKHPWFLNSIEGIKPYSDFYVWKDPKGFNASGHPLPPNNWVRAATDDFTIYLNTFILIFYYFYAYFCSAYSHSLVCLVGPLGNGIKNENNSTYISFLNSNQNSTFEIQF